MHVIDAANVGEALPAGVAYLSGAGAVQDSRAGPVIVAPGPVTTLYRNPRERVLFSPVRDANPFFHLLEAFWMLGGRDDSQFLDHYVKDFGARFAETGGRIHGAYGRRWRAWFTDPVGDDDVDQLKEVVLELTRSPNSRQAVVQMWDAGTDLGQPALKDRPCDTQVYFRLRRGELDMTVTCRSNDIIMGAYGANAVHFSFLQEYIAGMLRVPVGHYWQVSNGYHAYTADLDRLTRRAQLPRITYGTPRQGIQGAALAWALRGDTLHPRVGQNMVMNPETFDSVLSAVLGDIDKIHDQGPGAASTSFLSSNPYLWTTVHSAAYVHAVYKTDGVAAAIEAMDEETQISDPAWHKACRKWLQRKVKK